jgi:Tol biopolymer transport system component
MKPGCSKSKRSQRIESRLALPALGVAAALAIASAPAAAQSEAQRATPAIIASDQYESTPTFTPDGREVFFMRADRTFQRYRLLWSRCENGAWTTPQPPVFAAASDVLEGDPFVTRDGRRLYFISARDNADSENLDIWFVDRGAEGDWSAPRRLPSPVNSAASELLPRQAASGRLYFGSDRPGGLGQMDIYVAEQIAAGAWRVENAGAPISTAASEYEAEVSADERTMIVVADRGDRSHLYRFERPGAEWIERGRIPARGDVFQVGPLLSPRADRLLFAQADEDRSGEWFVIDLAPQVDVGWPPECGARRGYASKLAGDRFQSHAPARAAGSVSESPITRNQVGTSTDNNAPSTRPRIPNASALK